MVQNYPSNAGTKHLGDIIDRYLAEVTPLHRGCATESIRLKAMRRHVLASRPLATLFSYDFAKYQDERLKGDPSRNIKPAKPATAPRKLGIFRQVIEHARRKWRISMPENPLALVSRPKVQNARDRRLAPDEEAYLLAALETGDISGKAKRNPRMLPLVKPVCAFTVCDIKLLVGLQKNAQIFLN